VRKILELFLPPIVYGALRRLYWRVRHGKEYAPAGVGFEGWGMRSVHHPPWTDATGLEGAFRDANAEVRKAVVTGDVRLSQFASEPAEMVDALMWRHYVVFWSASFAAAHTSAQEKNLAECGVCDGLTIFFALSGAPGSKAYLYDAWAPMKDESLLASEKSLTGSYSYLDVENTRRNLARFAPRTVWNKGFIPEVFASADNPKTLIWLHIDLNSAKPTVQALEFFYDRIAPGGVILFDDYAWEGYEDTRLAVRRWCEHKDGRLLPLPTGQALFFKASGK
jgi:O-methyltransferase